MPRFSSTKNIFSQAGWTGLGTLSSRILGYVRDALMAALFPRAITDAWFVAFRIPNLVRRLFGEGALASGFTPLYVQLRNQAERDPAKALSVKSEHERADDLVLSTFCVLTLITGLAATIFGVWAEPILHALAPGAAFSGDLPLTIYFAQGMAAYMVLSAWFGLFSAVLNGQFRFRAAAFAPALWNVGMIGCAILAYRSPATRFWLAAGVVIGGVLQVGVVALALAQNEAPVPGQRRTLLRGLQVLKRTRLRSPDLRRVFARFLPTWVGLSANQMMILINTFFASQMIIGSNSWLFWADRLFELPLALFSGSLSTVLLPFLSSTAKQEEHRDVWAQTAQAFLWVALPCTVGFVMLSQPLVRLLFERGEFHAQDAAATSAVLQTFAFAIPSAGISRLLLTESYALHRVWRPALAAIGVCALHFWMMKLGIWGLDVQGLATSAVICSYVLMLILGAMRRWDAFWPSGNFWKEFLVLMAATLLMIGSLKIVAGVLPQGTSSLQLIVWMGLAIGIGTLSFFATGVALNGALPKRVWNSVRFGVDP